MSDEINEKIHILEQRHYFMTDTWEKRKILYDQNLDTQVFTIILYKRSMSKRLDVDRITLKFKYDSRSVCFLCFSCLNVMRTYWSHGYKLENPC